MKLFVKILLFTCLVFNINKVFVENNNLPLHNSGTEKSILVEKYLLEQKIKIESISIKYKLENNNKIIENIEKINFLIKALNKIQDNNLWEEKEKLIINAVLSEIKKINNELKLFLKKQKDVFDKKIIEKVNLYSKLWIKISRKIDNISLKLNANKLLKKNVLTIDEAKIKNSLVKLNFMSKKLKNFSKIKFNSQEEIKTSFIRILKSIKSEILILRNALKKD